MAASTRRALGIELHVTEPRVVLSGMLVDDGGVWDRTVSCIGISGDLQFFEDQPEDARESTPAAPGKKAAAPTGQTGSARGWWVQVLATSSEREAKARRSALSAHGYHAAVETMRGVKDPTQYRVRVGPYASREEAGRAKDVLARQEKANPWIVPPGQ
jgi:hypothetical protein